MLSHSATPRFVRPQGASKCAMQKRGSCFARSPLQLAPRFAPRSFPSPRVKCHGCFDIVQRGAFSPLISAARPIGGGSRPDG